MNRFKMSGWTLVAVGVGVCISALAMNVTMPAEPDIANTDLMMQRELYLLVGAALFLAGVITVATNRICTALDAIRQSVDRPDV